MQQREEESSCPIATRPPSGLLSSIFGDDSSEGKSSLTQSIFGNAGSKDAKNNNAARNDSIFSAPDQYRKLAKDRQERIQQQQQQQQMEFHSASTGVSKKRRRENDDETIFAARRLRTEQSRALVDELSIQPPGQSSPADDDDEEIRRGAQRLFVGQCDASFRKNGVLILKSIMKRGMLDKLREQQVKIQATVCKCLLDRGKRFRCGGDDTASESKHLQEEQEHSFQFHEVASRCLGRLDIRYQMDMPPFADADLVANRWLWPVVQSLLGKTAKLVYAGLILSFPHSADQPWHQDGELLFPEQQEGSEADLPDLPPYALNVFVPLNTVSERVGPTEFWIQSHKESKCRAIMEELRRNGGEHEEDDGNGAIVAPLLEAGDVLLYDYRICHRGTRNLSDTVRPMLYLMYARPWFHEHLNFGSERIILSEEETG